MSGGVKNNFNFFGSGYAGLGLMVSFFPARAWVQTRTTLRCIEFCHTALHSVYFHLTPACDLNGFKRFDAPETGTRSTYRVIDPTVPQKSHGIA